MSRVEDRAREFERPASRATDTAATSGSHEARRLYVDLTHLGRHVTGIERVAIEQFEKMTFEGAHVRYVRAAGGGVFRTLSMIWCQQVWLPLLAAWHRDATFVFPGFPPSPLFATIPSRTVMYVHDLFLVERRGDLGLKARVYMAPPFKIAIRKLTRFLVNSEKTRTELAPYVRTGAEIELYRPSVSNALGLDAKDRSDRGDKPRPLKLVSVGTIEPRKNYTAAVEILANLAAHGHPDAELHIVGRAGWGGAAARLTGHPRVHLHGYLAAEEAKAVAEAADLYLCSSHDEGLGLPLLEAQYAELPVVAPDKPVFREVLSASGTYIDTNDPDRAAAAIADLVATPGWRSAHAAKASANLARWNKLAAADRSRVARMFSR